jgi:carbonic anhydrase
MNSRSTFIASVSGALITVSPGFFRPASAAPAGPSVSAAAALARLKAGNARFIEGTETRTDLTERRTSLAKSQAPFATILTCSDSRLSPELIFDQSLGDLFVVRVAGNFLEDGGIGSMEYAFDHLHSNLVVVLGHEACGAVDATFTALKSGKPLPSHLDAFQHAIGPAIRATVAAGGTVSDCVVANAKYQAAALPKRSPGLAEGVHGHKLAIVAATYRLQSGKVTFY